MIYDIADPKCDIKELFNDFRKFLGRKKYFSYFDKWSVKSWISWNTQRSNVHESIINAIIEGWTAVGYIKVKEESKEDTSWHVWEINSGETRSDLPHHSSQNSRTQRRKTLPNRMPRN